MMHYICLEFCFHCCRLNSDFVVSGSKDETMKLWPISEALKCGEKNVTKLHAQVTKRAHEDEIHFVTVAPNDKFVASSSKDKTAKVCIYFLHDVC